jgi:hypothetical protein
MRLRWAESHYIRYSRSVLGEEPLVVFKIFKMLLRVLKNANRNAALQRTGMEIAMF